MTVGLETGLRNNRLAQISSAAGNAAVITLYSGTRPATGGAVTTPIVALVAGTPFAPAPVGGVLTMNPVSPGTASAAGTPTATWARLTTAGAAFVADMSVGTSGADINLNSVVISQGAQVSITSGTFTDGNP